jgi:predicted peptidase
MTAAYERESAVTGSGTQIAYYWMHPESMHGGQAYPLVLILHGAPGNAYAGQFLAQPKNRRKYPAFVFVPVLGTQSIWALPEGAKSRKKQRLPEIVSMVLDFAKSHPVDLDRIYVIGCSEGGYGAFGAARNYPGLFAAAVPISGGWNPAEADKLAAVPLLVMHGAQDSVIPVAQSRDVAAAVKDHGGNVKYIEFPDMGHNCPDARLYGADTWDWLFSQHK